jgi:hypothetical protein
MPSSHLSTGRAVLRNGAFFPFIFFGARRKMVIHDVAVELFFLAQQQHGHDDVAHFGPPPRLPPAATTAGAVWASWWSGRAIRTEKMKLEHEQSKRTFPCQMTHVRSQLPFGIQTNSPGQYKRRINEVRTQRVKAHFGVSK